METATLPKGARGARDFANTQCAVSIAYAMRLSQSTTSAYCMRKPLENEEGESYRVWCENGLALRELWRAVPPYYVAIEPEYILVDTHGNKYRMKDVQEGIEKNKTIYPIRTLFFFDIDKMKKEWGEKAFWWPKTFGHNTEVPKGYEPAWPAE